MSNLVINANSIYDRVIRIGRQTENLVSSITFNVNMWIEEYGLGECVLNVRRNGDGSAYPVPMTITDGLTTWTITDTDTAKKGRGEIQLVYCAGDKVKTSPIFTISCGESLVGGEVPEPYEEWLTELNRMTAQVEAAKTSASASAQTAQTAAGTATTKATEAEQSATTASGFAVNASASAASASTSAQAASQSAQAANVAKTAAEAAAISAQAEAEDAEAAKTAAQTAEANAQASEQTATEKASQAAEAQASADMARAEAEQAASRIYDFLPTDSASGAVASFSDGANNVPLKSLVVGINPVQDLHGYSSPWPAGGKGNILPTDTFKSARGITVTRNADGSVTFSGTSTSAGRFFMWNGNLVLTEDHVFSVGVTRQSSFSFNIGTSESNNAINIPVGSSSVTVPAGTYVNWSVYIGANTPMDMTLYPMLKLSTDTDTTFFPYSNICPISGWAGINLQKCGKNLIDPSKRTKKSNTIYHWYAVDGFVLKQGTTYTLSSDTTATAVYLYTINGTLLRGGHATETYTPSEDITAYFQIYNASVADAVNIMLEVGSAATDFEPYIGTEIPISWESEAGTVYGGSLDVLTGVLTVTRYGFDGGTVNWAKSETYAYGKFSINTSPLAAYSVSTPTVISSAYKSAANSSAGSKGTYVWIRSSSENIRQLRVKDDSKDNMTVEEFKVAMAGVQFVYELATPITYQLTPHEVKTLLGSNTFYADTGDTAVEYRADIKAYINRKIAEAIAALS